MKIDRAGYPFIAAAVAPAIGLAAARRHAAAVAFGLLGGFFAYFFRDPDRTVPQAPGLVVSPADGRVMISGPSDGRWSPPGHWKQVTIFLSPLDVHINRAPIAGLVSDTVYTPGRFVAAYDPTAGEVNERCAVRIQGDQARVTVVQVAGVVARRIVCRVGPGDKLEAGQRFGMIRFGSRTDCYMPKGTDVRVKVGDRVIGGVTVVGLLP
jgi:phosphatidylserine decarboxylase